MASISCGVKGRGIESGSPSRLYLDAVKKKAAEAGGLFTRVLLLQRGLDLESPSLQQGLRNVFRILVATRPFTQSRGALVLLGFELELLHCLFEGGHNGNHRADRLWLSPVRISATLCHDR